MEINRKIIIEKAVEKLKESLAVQTSSYNAAVQASIDAPGAMESHSDTTKKQKAWEADNYIQRIGEIRDEIKYINSLEKYSQNSNVVAVGDIVRVEDKSGNGRYYFIVEKCESLIFNDLSLFVVSVQTPIAKFILGKKIGSLVEVNNLQFTIAEIS